MLLLLASGSISKSLLLCCIGLFPTKRIHVDFMILPPVFSIAYFSLSINGRGKLIVLLLSICHLQEAMISILCKMTSDAGLWGGAETAEQRFFCSKRRRRTHLFFVLKLF
jgi:hypothetical protein